MKVAIYLSGIPVKSKNEQKRQVLTDFGAGVLAAGDEVIFVDNYTTVDCDLAVIQGWVNSKAGAHLRIRGDAIDRQLREGKHIVAIDSNLFGFLEPNDFNRYLRYSLDGIFPTTGDYFNHNIDPVRWQNIKQNYGFVERDWNRNGSNILICLQRHGGWSMGKTSVFDWLDTIIPKIRKNSDRPIIIRPHPGNLAVVPNIQLKWPNTRFSNETDIRSDLNNAWATVTYNSSPGVASLIWGVPVWVTDPDPNKSQAGPWAMTKLSKIEAPLYPDREAFYNQLSQCHFNSQELTSGMAWRFMRQRLPNTPRQ